MATFFFETMTPDEALNYAFATDQIIFTTPGLSAAQVSVIFVPFTANTPDYITLNAPFKSLTFNDPGGLRTGGASESDFAFTDSSLLFVGTLGDDNRTGTGGADGMYGGTGSDTLDGAVGNDVLQGNQGDDSLVGGTGLDVMYGGRDNDTINTGTGGTVDLRQFAQGNLGDDSIVGGAGADLLLGG